MRSAIIWNNCPAIFTKGNSASLRGAISAGKKGVELHRKMSNSMGSRLIISGLTLFARGAASGMIVRRGARCAKFQCLIITLGDRHLRPKFEGYLYVNQVDQIMCNTTGPIQEEMGMRLLILKSGKGLITDQPRRQIGSSGIRLC